MRQNETEPYTDVSELPWDDAIGRLLEELSRVQGELLGLLDEKRQALVRADLEAMANIEPRERRLIERLEACQTIRAQLLARAAGEGLPADSIQAIASTLQTKSKHPFGRQISEAQARSRLLHHHSLTNWVLVQRTLIHLSQMLEIIATGGRGTPTYEQGKSASVRGSFVDQAV